VFTHAPRFAISRRIMAFLSPELKAAVGRYDALEVVEARLPPEVAGYGSLARDQYVEAKALLAGCLLSSQGDRVGMAHSIEGRVPYLDHRVIEFANRLSERFEIRGLTEKAVPRRALAGLLPDEILHRTKQPYRAPDSASFFVDGEPLDYVADRLSAEAICRAGYFDHGAVGKGTSEQVPRVVV